MLTKADLGWLKHLSDSKKVKILPYNPKVKLIFEKQKKEILNLLGQEIEILHRGATAMGISGQGEIDIFIPIPLAYFDKFISKLKKAYSDPRSFYVNNRVRFNNKIDNINIEIILVNKDSEGWRRNLVFENYLKADPKALEKYRKLKEESSGLSIKEYYRRKIEFANEILKKALKFY